MNKQMCALSHPAMSHSLRPHGLRPARLLCLWNFPGKNTAGGCYSLLQDLPDPGTELPPKFLALAGGSLPPVPPPKTRWIQRQTDMYHEGQAHVTAEAESLCCLQAEVQECRRPNSSPSLKA